MGGGSGGDGLQNCTCEAGYSAADCSAPPCGGAGGGCGEHGTCVRGACVCTRGAWGSTCGATAPCAHGCWGQGSCVRGECVCGAGFSGTDCRYEVYANDTRQPRKLLAQLPAGRHPSPPLPPPPWRANATAAAQDYVPFYNYTGHGYWASASKSRATLPPLRVYDVAVSSSADFHSLSGNAVAGRNAVDGNEATSWSSSNLACRSQGGCLEWLVLDLGAVQAIGALRCSAHVSGAEDLVTEVIYSASHDNATWSAVLPVYRGADVLPYYGLEAELRPSVRARFLRVSLRRAAVANGSTPAYFKRVLVKEFSAWGPDGPFGALPPAATITGARRSLASLFGINSIWGFFSDVYADRHRPGWGSSLSRHFSVLQVHSMVPASSLLLAWHLPVLACVALACLLACAVHPWRFASDHTNTLRIDNTLVQVPGASRMPRTRATTTTCYGTRRRPASRLTSMRWRARAAHTHNGGSTGTGSTVAGGPLA